MKCCAACSCTTTARTSDTVWFLSVVNHESISCTLRIRFAASMLCCLQLDEDGSKFPNVAKYVERLSARPAFQKVFGGGAEE